MMRAALNTRASATLVGCLLAATLVLHAVIAAADDEARADAWWTGPMLAPSPAVLPPGHALLEPYLFDEMSNASFDDAGRRHSGPYEHTLGSQTYMLFGLTDQLTAGLIPRFAYNEPAGAPNSSYPGVGDVTLQAGYGLTQYSDGSYVPALAAIVQETLPTGRYDHLTRASDGFGAGAYTTALALYSQDYFWMPNGRILRMRLDLTYTMSSSVSVHDLSVYGTADGFSGHARPGNSFTADLAGEYSLTRNWVLALDVVYQGNGNTAVSGVQSPAALPLPPQGPPAPGPYVSRSGTADSVAFAPAIEYNFSSAVGVLLGVRIIEIGRNTSGSITPAVALNMVL
jgi:Putative MetA-pathway of phenol degradation